MSPVTPKRIRLSVAEKAKIIEDSRKPGFDKKKIEKKYGISRPAILSILKNQNEILKAVDSGSMNKKCKSLKKSSLYELETKLYDWLCRHSKKGLPISNQNSCSNLFIVFLETDSFLQ